MKVRIPTRDGNAFDAHLSLPPGNKGPGVVMIPEIFGVNEGIHRAADLFARQGYVVLALDIFWRMERNVELGYDEAGFEKAYALHAAFDYEQGVADMGDAVAILGDLFLGDVQVGNCRDSMDVDDNGFVEITDGIYLLSFLFSGGNAPASPFAACGVDRGGASPGCESYAPCAQ